MACSQRLVRSQAPGAACRSTRSAQLPGADRRLFVEAWLRLMLTIVALRTIGFRRLMHFTPAESERRPSVHEETFIMQRIASIERAARYQLRPAMCLPRSVVLHQWLRQYGILSQLRLGVAKRDQQFAAHAWIEVGDNVVYESTAAASRFTPLVAADGTVSPWGRS